MPSVCKVVALTEQFYLHEDFGRHVLYNKESDLYQEHFEVKLVVEECLPLQLRELIVKFKHLQVMMFPDTNECTNECNYSECIMSV